MPTLPFRRSAMALGLAAFGLAARAQQATVTTQLAPVIVQGNYDNAVGSSDAASQGGVTAKLIASRPTLRPAEVLEFLPGVIVTQHSGDGKANQYFLRGFNLDHGTDFASFVAGMPVNMPTHAHGQGYSDLDWLLPELVNRIDYKKGPTTPTRATSLPRARRASACSTACRTASPRSRWARTLTGAGWSRIRPRSAMATCSTPSRPPTTMVRGTTRKSFTASTACCATASVMRTTSRPSPRWAIRPAGTRPTRSRNVPSTRAWSGASARSTRATAGARRATACRSKPSACWPTAASSRTPTRCNRGSTCTRTSASSWRTRSTPTRPQPTATSSSR